MWTKSLALAPATSRQHSRVNGPAAYPRIAFLVNLSTSYGRRILEGIHSHPQRVSWELLAESWGDIGLADLLSGENADGLVVDGGDPRLAQLLRQSRKPVVDVSGGAATAGCSSVTADYAQIGRLAAEHFHERGFTKVAFLGLHRSPGTSEIGGAFLEAVSSFASSVRRHSTPLMWSGQRSTQRDGLLAWLGALPRPCAIFAADDIAARRLLQGCRRLGLRVPQEVAVLGVGDYEMVHTVTDPSLSTVIVPAHEIGLQAAECLQRLLESASGTAPVHLKVASPSIAVRRSTDSLAWEDPILVQALEWLADHLAEAIKIPLLASQLSVSRRLLEQRFQATLGHGPAEELRRLRMRRAEQLLRETDWGLAQVARTAGLQTPERLCALFRRRLDTTPGEYRKRLHRTP